jgi:hypothetical protein
MVYESTVLSDMNLQCLSFVGYLEASNPNAVMIFMHLIWILYIHSFDSERAVDLSLCMKSIIIIHDTKMILYLYRPLHDR